MPHLSFLFICLVWGANFILMERASHALGPVAIGIWRLGGGTAVLGVVWWFRRSRYHVAARDVAKITFVTFISTAIPFVTLPYVLSRGFGHSFFGMMVALVPLATILMSIPMLRILPTWRQLVGVLGGLVCIGLILQDGSARGMSPGLLGLAILTPITYSFGNTFVKWQLDHVPALPLTTLLLGIGLLMIVPLEIFPSLLDRFGLGGPAEPHGWPLAIAALVFLSVLGTGISILLFLRLVISQGPLFAGMTTYVVPVLALVWGGFDGEKITALQMAAIVGVLLMVALVQSAKPQPPEEMVAGAEGLPHGVHLDENEEDSC